MKVVPNVSTLAERIADWINDQKIPCYYAGIRSDCAFDMRMAPNNAAFNAAFDRVEVSCADWYRDYMVAFVS